MAQELICPMCKGTKFEDGELSTEFERNAVKFRIRTSMITSDWRNVAAQRCVQCGYIVLFTK